MPRVEVGELSPEQLIEINAFRQGIELNPIEAKILFIGSHVYKSRIVENNYSIEDVLIQIERAMGPGCILRLRETGTAFESPTPRDDGYGNLVKDRVVLECNKYKPKTELRSAIPIGDTNKPPKK